MDQAGVPANSELRRSKSILFPKDIREIPTELPLSIALPLPPLEQPLVIQDSSLDAEVAIETAKGKEVPPPTQATQSEDQLTIKDVVSKAKDVEEANLQVAGSKGDSQPSKAQMQDLFLFLLPLFVTYFFLLINGKTSFFILCVFIFFYAFKIMTIASKLELL